MILIFTTVFINSFVLYDNKIFLYQYFLHFCYILYKKGEHRITTEAGCATIVKSIVNSGGYREMQDLPLMRELNPAETAVYNAADGAVRNIDGNHRRAVLYTFW